MHPAAAVIFLSVKDAADSCAQAARLGDYDIILMPFQETCLMTAIRTRNDATRLASSGPKEERLRRRIPSGRRHKDGGVETG